MGFIRTLHILKYDKNAKRFTSDAFKKHKNGGISVFDEECAREASNKSLCNHIKIFYSTTVGNPICYCKLDWALLKKASGFDNIEIVEEESNSGDICHRDLRNFTNGASEKFFKNNFRPPNIFMCCNNAETQITNEQYEDLLNNLCEAN